MTSRQDEQKFHVFSVPKQYWVVKEIVQHLQVHEAEELCWSNKDSAVLYKYLIYFLAFLKIVVRYIEIIY